MATIARKMTAKTIAMPGRRQMDSSLLRARSATHLKIILVSLVAAIVVVVVGVNARTGSFDTAANTTGPMIVKATKTPTYAGNKDAAVR